jgi:hypothetical protein
VLDGEEVADVLRGAAQRALAGRLDAVPADRHELPDPDPEVPLHRRDIAGGQEGHPVGRRAVQRGLTGELERRAAGRHD